MAMARNGVHEVGDADRDIALGPIPQNSLVDNEADNVIRNNTDDADAEESRESNGRPSQFRPDMSATENVGISEARITDNPSTDEPNSEELAMSSNDVVHPKEAKSPSAVQRQNVESSLSNNESDETNERCRINSAEPDRSTFGTTSSRDTRGRAVSTSSCKTDKPHKKPSDSIPSPPSSYSALHLCQVRPPNHQVQHISNNHIQGNRCSYAATPQRFSGPQNNPQAPSPVRRHPNSPLGHENAAHQSQGRNNGQIYTRNSPPSLQTYDPPTTSNHISVQSFQEHNNQVRSIPQPDFRNFFYRIKTFVTWPTDHPIKPEDLARAGFYYLNDAGRCKCFSCGAVLRQWEPSDDAYVEHARHSPECSYIRQYKGEDFVKAVQELTEDGNTVTNSQVVELMTSREVSTINRNNSTSSVGATNVVALRNQERAGYSAPSALSELHMGVAELAAIEFEQFGNRDEPEGQNYSLQGEALALLCLVCQQSRVRIVFVPCQHLVCCMPCSEEQRQCPVPTCHENIRGMEKVSLRSLVEYRNGV